MSSSIPLPLLSQVQIASPCPAKWADMKGDDTTRFCAECSLHVHNISNMTAHEAEEFLQGCIGANRACIRLFRKTDGTILLRDCPVGLALWRQRIGGAVGRVAAAVIFVCMAGIGISSQRREQYSLRLRSMEPFRSVCEWLSPAPSPLQFTNLAPVPAEVMGDPVLTFVNTPTTKKAQTSNDRRLGDTR